MRVRAGGILVVVRVRVRRLRRKFSLSLFLGLFMTTVYMAVARPVTVCIGRVILMVVGWIIFGSSMARLCTQHGHCIRRLHIPELRVSSEVRKRY
jgi:hypothetical protein